MRLTDFLEERLIDTMGIEKILAKEIYDYFLALLETHHNFLSIIENNPPDVIRGKNYVTPEILNKLKEVFPNKDLSKLGIFVSPEVQFPNGKEAIETFKRASPVQIKKTLRMFRAGNIDNSYFFGFSISNITLDAKKGIDYKTGKLLPPDKLKYIETAMEFCKNTHPSILIQFKVPFIVRDLDWKTEKHQITTFLSHEIVHLFQGLYYERYGALEDKIYNREKLSKEKIKIRPREVFGPELVALFGGGDDEIEMPKMQQQEIESKTYMNKPAEMGGWAKSFYDEMVNTAKKGRLKITQENFKDIAMMCRSYAQMKANLRDKNFNKVLKMVWQKFFD